MISLSHPESIYQEDLYALPAKVLILIDRTWEEITPEDRVLLAKILGSVKLSLSAVQIMSGKKFELSSFQAFAPQRVIAFGATLKDQATSYEVLSTEGTMVLHADALNALDDQKKKRLWNALKQMFGLLS
jgi:DNA polymerase III psi subunit